MSTLAFHSEENFEIVILKSFRIRDFIGHDSMFALDFVSTTKKDSNRVFSVTFLRFA